jgi:hypothetical protein
MYYTKLNVDILPLIKNEVIDYFKRHSDKVIDNPEKEYFVQLNMEELPILNQFLEDYRVSEVVETSSCFLPPYSNLRKHIDGLKTDCDLVPEGKLKANKNVLIIPIENTEDSISYWYNNEDVSDEDETIVRRIRPEPPYDFYVSFCEKELEPVESTTINQMTFIKSDVYHTVHNNGDKTRLVVIIRFKEENHYTLNDIFKYEELI